MNKFFRNIIPGLALALAAGLPSCELSRSAAVLAQVDPVIGTDGHGHVFVGANVPFGMVQAGPQQIIDAWDWCSGYHRSDSLIIGFSHTHLSGTGIGDLGDVLLMPYNVENPLETSLFMRRKNTEAKHIYAPLDHSREVVLPGYYKLYMPHYGVSAELTATQRSAVHRYVFEGDESAVLLDLCSGIGWDNVTSWDIQMPDSVTVTGFRRSEGWAKDQQVFFYAEFSKPFSLGEKYVITAQPTEALGDVESAVNLLFDTSSDKTLSVRVGISAVSVEGARDNLLAEQKADGGAWLGFDALCAKALRKWSAALARVEIEPLDAEGGRVFYTALYHAMIAPALFSDVSGDYRGADGRVYNSERDKYTVFSLWDAYRAAFPLMTLLEPSRSSDFAQSFLDIWRQQGKLPVWHLWGNETDCMVGNPGVIILGDYVKKGLVGNKAEALEAMAASQLLGERGLELLGSYGFIPYDKSAEVETVAKALEFAIADHAVAEVADLLADPREEFFRERSKVYSKYFDPGTGFMRARAADGSFREPFDPFRALHMQDDYTEGNAWQYTWLVPHDVPGLIGLFGSRDAFLEKLDSLFIAEGDLGGNASDVTGLIGQYAHGNEPVHHVAYMYNVAGRHDRTCEVVRAVMDSLYTAAPDGLCGNEDVGQMSSWYVLSALGLYQMDPVGGDWQIGSPAVRKAVLHLENGRTFTIRARNNSKKNIYVRSIRLNGELLAEPHISYADIMAGGELELEMSPEPAGSR